MNILVFYLIYVLGMLLLYLIIIKSKTVYNWIEYEVLGLIRNHQYTIAKLIPYDREISIEELTKLTNKKNIDFKELKEVIGLFIRKEWINDDNGCLTWKSMDLRDNIIYNELEKRETEIQNTNKMTMTLFMSGVGIFIAFAGVILATNMQVESNSQLIEKIIELIEKTNATKV